jgi:hypothetical protein
MLTIRLGSALGFLLASQILKAEDFHARVQVLAIAGNEADTFNVSRCITRELEKIDGVVTGQGAGLPGLGQSNRHTAEE